MFEIFEKFDYHLAVIIGNRRASMNHLANVLFKPVVSVLLYGSLECIGKLNLHKAQFVLSIPRIPRPYFNRAKLANYVISLGFHKQAFHGQAAEFSCPGFHDKQQNSLPMHCNGCLNDPGSIKDAFRHRISLSRCDRVRFFGKKFQDFKIEKAHILDMYINTETKLCIICILFTLPRFFHDFR